MGRWQPGAGSRLRQAAMELYRERGYDRTTVAEIAEHAGVTERTFFRYFADKREVLFAGSDELVAALVAALDDAPASAAPLDRVAAALERAADLFPDRDYARQRQAVIAAHPDLQERELTKMATLSAAFAAALHDRGVSGAAASLSAETGVAIFKVAFERWIAESEQRGFDELVRESLGDLKAAIGR